MLLFIDTETTGLDPNINDIIQIAGILPGHRFNYYMKPINLANIDFTSLAVNNISVEKLSTFEDPGRVVSCIVRKLPGTKITLAGWNVHFDMLFLKSLFHKLRRKDFDELFDYRVLDIQSCVRLRLGLSVNFREACKLYGVNLPNHTADGDVSSAYDLYRKLGGVEHE
jgi:oligoribonuclease (3'-5' exoribonuclease)